MDAISLGIDSLLECPACHDEFVDPHTLPCFHSFCLKCLPQHNNETAEGSYFQCPTAYCTQRCEVTEMGIRDIRKNFILTSIKEIMQQRRATLSTSPKCDKHTNLPTDMHCQKCQRLVCVKCCFLEHKHHLYREVVEQTTSQRTSQNTTALQPGFDSLLECPICLHNINDPRMLPCLHSMCRSCLDQHIRSAAEGIHFRCPVCNHQCEVPAEGVTAIPKDTLLISLKEITGIGLASINHEKNCNEHLNLPNDMYCETCRLSTCLKCCLLKHQRHKYLTMEEVTAQSKSLVMEWTETVESILKRVQEHMEQLYRSGIDMTLSCDKACEKLRQNAEEIHALVNERENSARQKVREIEGAAFAQLKAATDEANSRKTALENLLSSMHALLESEDSVTQVDKTSSLQKSLQEQLCLNAESPLQSVILTLDLQEKFQSMSDMLGEVSVHQSIKERNSLGSALSDLKLRVKDDVSGLAMIGDCLCVTEVAEPSLWIHNTKPNKHKRHTLKGLLAAGMTLVHGDTLVITDYRKKIHLVVIDQKMDIIQHVVNKIPFYPSDASYEPVRQKLILANCTGKEIVVCNTKGNIENTVNVKTCVDCTFRSALVSTDGYVVLDCSRQGKLLWVDADGAVAHTYTENLKSPCHIVQDSQGRVIIADKKKHRVHLVGVNKELSQYLLTAKHGIKHPTCLYLDKDKERLFVGCKDNDDAFTVRIYNWPFTSGSPPGGRALGTHYQLHVELARCQ